MLEHRNLVNLIRYQYKYTNIDFQIEYYNLQPLVSMCRRRKYFQPFLRGATLPGK